MNPPPNARPIDSAAIVLLCDGPTGPEVFMLRRHDKMATHAGAYVFPGGKVEAADAGFHGGGRLDQPSAALRQALDEPGLDEAAATSLYVAAIRETFEECGVLLAHRPGEEDRAPTIAPHTGAFA